MNRLTKKWGNVVSHKLTIFVLGFALVLSAILPATVLGATSSGSIGLEGKISAPPPTTPATITFPSNGTTTTEQSVTVTGICPKGLLVKIFKNNVFSGSVQCQTGSYSIKIDLFTGLNEIVARVYDDLDQPGPDSNIVRVTVPSNTYNLGAQLTLTSSFAKKGSPPGEKISWPITIAGGSAPYAISVDWGDGKTSDIISQSFAGTFNIEHTYDNPGIYNVVVRATDKSGGVAFLQLVAIANGPLSQNSTGSSDSSKNNSQTAKPIVKVMWQPAALTIPLIISTFYLGRKYEIHVLRRRLEQRDSI